MSTLAKSIIQSRVGQVPLHGFPNTPRYRFFIEELPFWGGTILLVCLVAWSLWRLETRRDWVCLVTTVAAAAVAWLGVIYTVAGNSMDAFP